MVNSEGRLWLHERKALWSFTHSASYLFNCTSCERAWTANQIYLKNYKSKFTFLLNQQGWVMSDKLWAVWSWGEDICTWGHVWAKGEDSRPNKWNTLHNIIIYSLLVGEYIIIYLCMWVLSLWWGTGYFKCLFY